MDRWPLRQLWVCRSPINECLKRALLGKIGGPKIFYACVQLAEVNVPHIDTRRKGGDDSFLKIWLQGKDSQLNTKNM